MSEDACRDFIVSVWDKVSEINTEVMIPLAEAKLKDRTDLANGLLFFARRCFDKGWYDPVTRKRSASS